MEEAEKHPVNVEKTPNQNVIARLQVSFLDLFKCEQLVAALLYL